MAVYRVQRTRDYTVMSNYHLKDKGLTLKSKGLLSMILSLPEEWNYTTRGLASICKEGVDAIGSALKELETAGYIVRRQLRGANGRITDFRFRQGANWIFYVRGETDSYWRSHEIYADGVFQRSQFGKFDFCRHYDYGRY